MASVDIIPLMPFDGISSLHTNFLLLDRKIKFKRDIKIFLKLASKMKEMIFCLDFFNENLQTSFC